MPVNPFDLCRSSSARACAGGRILCHLSSKDYESWRPRAAQTTNRLHDGASDREHAVKGCVAAMFCRGFWRVPACCRALAVLGADMPANVFYRPLGAIPSSITLRTEERQRISEGITATVKEGILPAYRRLHDFMRDEYCPARG